MGQFLESEKQRQAAAKLKLHLFSVGAQNDGEYKNKPRSFCLPKEFACENLFQGIRQRALSFFRENEIKWHDGINGSPSNHLCDSQVCCVNFLFPFSDKPEALRKLLCPLFPTIKQVLPIEKDLFVTFEYVGQQNYLGERKRPNAKRTRGANFTSADSAVLFEHQDGRRQLVLVEWKYTESYSSTSLRLSKNGTDRTKIYSRLWKMEDCPLNKAVIPSFSSLFFEPFYQLMRQQLLAHEIERAHEFGVDICSFLHIAPGRNLEFQNVTSPRLKSVGPTVNDVWAKIVRRPDRFRSVKTEHLFNRLALTDFPELTDWWKYITERYSTII